MSSRNHPHGRTSLHSDTRGVAYQVDFAVALGVTVTTLIFVMLMGSILITSAQPIDRSTDLSGFRAGDRLADDVLATSPNGAAVNVSCAESYFNTENSTATATACGYSPFDSTNATTYLHSSLGLAYEYGVNVSVTGDSGTLEGDYDSNGITVRYATGPEPPSGDVAMTHRQFVFTTDIDSDGTREPYTLYVTIWEY